MADLLFAEQGAPTTPGAGDIALFPHSSSKQWASKDSTGKILTFPGIKNWNNADVVANAADTYLAGSALAVPSHGLQAGTLFKWRLYMTKTGAGVAAPVWVIRVGTLGTVGDTIRCTFTGPAQTGVIDTGFVEIAAILRNTGAAGILAGGLILNHNLAATGFANIGSPTLQNTSAGFDTTVANLIIGISVNPGAAGVWTHQIVKAEMLNI
jgi:hypothetical protein